MKKALFLLLLLPLLLYFRPKEPTCFSGVAMTVPYKILVGHSLDAKQKHTIEKAIHDVFAKTNRIYNKFNPESELSNINDLKGGEWCRVSPELFTLLKITDGMYRQTEQKFDPTAASTMNGWQQIQLKDGDFFKERDEVRIDLGGIAKGYTIDQMVETLNGMGYGNVLVDWGGDFRASGKHPEGRAWSVGITFPGMDMIDTVELVDCALATSGDYLQNWVEDGERYFHIYDPKTGMPLKMGRDGIHSSSVQAKTATEADALATALMLFEVQDEANEWMETQDVINWWLVATQ